MSVELIDLIDKLNLNQKTINDLNENNIFYVYELLSINPRKDFNDKMSAKPALTDFERKEIEQKIHNCGYKFIFELTEEKQKEVYDHINAMLNEKFTKEIENQDIDCFRFSARINNSLNRAGYDNLLKVSQMSILDLKKIRNLGVSSIEKILIEFHKKGIYLRGEDIKDINGLAVVKNTLEKFEDENLFLIEQAQKKMKTTKTKYELLGIMKKVNTIIELSDKREDYISNELISYMYLILNALRENANKEKIEKIEEIEKILKTLYVLDSDEDIKKLKKEC